MKRVPRSLEGLVRVLKAELARQQKRAEWDDTAEFLYRVLRDMGEIA